LYQSIFLGSEGITNYPIGVVQNSQGDVLIADNHNNFNLTIFNQGKEKILKFFVEEGTNRRDDCELSDDALRRDSAKMLSLRL
jgi:hypothetical protein